MNAMLSELKFSVRTLVKRPKSTLVIILLLALGIGTTTAIYSITKVLIIEPFQFEGAERVACIWNRVSWPLSMPDFMDLREQNQSFEVMGVFSNKRLNLGAKNPESLYGIECTSGVFPTYGVQPVMGRWLEKADENPGAQSVVVISHELWQRAFAGSPEMVGQDILLNGHNVTVVGIMPANYEFQTISFGNFCSDFWIPIPESNKQFRGTHWLFGIGRLKPGVSFEAADADLKLIGKRLMKMYPDTNARKQMKVRSLHWQATSRFSSTSFVFPLAAGLLLLAACANVSNLMLAQGMRQQSENGLRKALGASTFQIIRLVFCKALMLAMSGCLLGMGVAFWFLQLIKAYTPATILPLFARARLQVDGETLLFAVIAAMLSAIVAGLLPALLASRSTIQHTLNQGTRSYSGSKLQQVLNKGLLMIQIAIAILLLHVALIVSAHLRDLYNQNRWLAQEEVLTAEILLHGDPYNNTKRRLQFWTQLQDRLNALNQTQVVGLTSKLPLAGGQNSPILVDDQPYETGIRRPNAEVSRVTPEYFEAMGIPLLTGRLFKPETALPKTTEVVVNQAMVNEFWPDENPIGRTIRPNQKSGGWTTTVVGVVRDALQWNMSQETAKPEIYFPIEFGVRHQHYLVARSASGPALSLLPEIRKELKALNPEIPLVQIRSMKGLIETAYNTAGGFGLRVYNTLTGFSMLITLIGIYSSVSYYLAQRKKEIGIRMALGASPAQMVRFVIRNSASWLLGGLLLGLICALVASKLMGALLIEMNEWALHTFLIEFSFISASAIAACLIPTLAAIRSKPLDVLRDE